MLNISFYDGVKYGRLDFINRDLDFFGNGCVNLTDFSLTYPATPNMTVNVGAGTTWVDGYRIANDTNLVTLTVATASSQARIDIIQIGHDDINKQAVLQIKQGVPGASPVEPGADAGYLKLYAINVGANVTSITSGNVTDRRVLVPLKVSGSQISYAGTAGLNQANTFAAGYTQTFAGPVALQSSVSLAAGQTFTNNGIITGGTINASSVPWSGVTGAPTTLSGYGISLSGDVTNSGNVITLANSGVTAGTYPKVTVDAKGRVTAGASLVAADIPSLDWSKITTGKPTTIAGYGITDNIVSSITAGANISVTNPTGLGPATVGITGVIPIANGGTGSSTQNFVDSTTNQTVAGTKSFSNKIGVPGGDGSYPGLWFTNLAASGFVPWNNIGVFADNAGAIGINAGVSGVYTMKNGVKNNILDDGTGQATFNVGTTANQYVRVQAGTGNTINFVPNASSGGYNPITASGDSVISGGGSGAATTNVLTIVPWSGTKSGIRLTGTGGVYSANNTLDDGITGKATFANKLSLGSSVGTSIKLQTYEGTLAYAMGLGTNMMGTNSMDITMGYGTGGDTEFNIGAPTSSAYTAYTSLLKVKIGGAVTTKNNTLDDGGVGNATIAGNLTVNGNGGSFANSKYGNGYQKLPGGLIIQWGMVSVSANIASVVNFPVAFPTQGLNASASPLGNTNAGISALISLTQIGVISGSSTTVYWNAIGY